MHTRQDVNDPFPYRFILEDNLLPYRDFIRQNAPAPVDFAPDSVISRSGTPGFGVYFLLAGMVKVSTLNINGYERILGYHKKNTLFVMDGLRSTENLIVTTTAVTPVSAVYLSIEMLFVLFQKKSEFATDALIYYSDILKLMCYDAGTQYGSSVLFRLANFIVLYMQSEDFRTENFLPFSQSELASAIGASRVQVARVCSELKEQGYIDVKKRKLYVLNQEYFNRYIINSKLR